MRLIRRLYWTAVLYAGNLHPDNRAYWGWVKLTTAWQAARPLRDLRPTRWWSLW